MLNSKRIKNIIKEIDIDKLITDEAVQYAFNVKKKSAACLNISPTKPAINGANDE